MKKIIIFLLLVIFGLLGYIFYQKNNEPVIGGCSLFNKVLNNCHLNHDGDELPCIGDQCFGLRIPTKEQMEDYKKIPISQIEHREDGSSTRTLTYTSDSGNTMTNTEALAIAKKSECNSDGVFTGESYFNQNSGGLVSLNMETEKQGCGLRCDVSIDNKTAKAGWMCTGALFR